jgi:hypothetical protein
VPRGNVLAFVAVEVLQVSLRHLARAALVDHLVHHRHRRLGQDADARRSLEFSGPSSFTARKASFSRETHVAHAALSEGDGRAAGANPSTGIRIELATKSFALASLLPNFLRP